MGEPVRETERLWVIDQTNQRGDQIHERDVAKQAMPRRLAEEYVRWLKSGFPDRYYAVREASRD